MYLVSHGHGTDVSFDPTPMSDEGMHISVPATDTLLALAQDPVLWRATCDPPGADSPEVDCAQAVLAAGPGPTVPLDKSARTSSCRSKQIRQNVT